MSECNCYRRVSSKKRNILHEQAVSNEFLQIFQNDCILQLKLKLAQNCKLALNIFFAFSYAHCIE